MNAKRILNFLNNIAVNNNRDWFNEHKDEYLACRAEFEAAVAQAIAAISAFDSDISHVKVKEACFRFHRDTRFSPDKSPYKRHFGAYISAKGRKSMHAGYYLHLEPGKCLLSAGAYWLPTNVLTACRNEIMVNIDNWRAIVENGEFIRLFGYANEGAWEGETISKKGFGIERLKTCPKDFPRDFPHLSYLKMKDYACWHMVGNEFFDGDAWLKPMTDVFKVAKPMMDFTNSVIDDYE